MSFMKDFNYLKIQMKDIVSATNNFDPTKEIGHGGFGRVYKGELSSRDGRITVAFKKLDPRLGQGSIEFWKEIMMLSKYKHENVISLKHFCTEGDEMILVYEYAARGSLDQHLSDASTLTWIRRLKICVGAARGLQFLHDPKETHHRVIHRDVKSANILLDENWTAKVSDFGLSKIGLANQGTTYMVSHGVGTPGYCDPLYLEFGFLSKESDVYSFGVVLFEILCGRLCYEYRDRQLDKILVPVWKRCYHEKRLDDIILPGLKEQIDPGSLKSYSAIAFQCLKRAREERPIMSKILEELEFSLEQQEIFENTLERGNIEGKLREKSTKMAADHFEPIGIEGQRESGVWVHHHPSADVAHVWEPRKGKNRVHKDRESMTTIIKSEPIPNYSSSTEESLKEEPVGYALVNIVEGSDMKPSDMNGLADPYIKGKLGVYRFKTKIQKKTLSPKWFEEFKIPIDSWDSPSLLEIGVHNKNLIFDDTLGDCCVEINEYRDGQRHDMWLPLQNIKMGRLHLAITVIEANDMVFEQQYDDNELKNEFKKKDGSKKLREKSTKMAADHVEPIGVEGQRETGIWVHHHPSAHVAQVWEPRKGKKMVHRDSELVTSSIRSEPSQNDSSSTKESLEGNKPKSMNMVQWGFHKVSSLFHKSPETGG